MKGRIIVPTNLSEISLAQYQHFLKVSEGLEGNDLKTKMVSVFCKVDEELVKAFSRADVEEFSTILDGMFKNDYPFIPKFTIDGKSFGFIPSLEEMTYGEYVDLDNYISDWDKMHKAMAVLFRPIIKTKNGNYIIEEYESSDKYSELMKLMPLSCAMGAMVFFYHLGIELLKAIPLYLAKQMEMIEKETSQNKANLINNGDGILQSINLLRETLGDSMKLLNLDWQRHLHT
mgnify:CR=1 FL=1